MAAPAWVGIAGVIATWTVAFLALFGDRLRCWMNQPKVEIELADKDGVLEVETLRWIDNGVPKERSREARYYRLRVRNARRNSPVHDVQLMVEAIERPGPGNQPVLDYPGPLPLDWQHSQVFPQARTIGPPAVVDFLVVTEERTLKLRTVIAPNVYATEYALPTHRWITVVARGLEHDSQPVRFKVDWDGEWDRGQAEMRSHLTIDVETA
jgi:hypothetical protein